MKNPACLRRPGRCDGILALWLRWECGALRTRAGAPVDQKRYSPLTETMLGSKLSPFLLAL